MRPRSPLDGRRWTVEVLTNHQAARLLQANMLLQRQWTHRSAGFELGQTPKRSCPTRTRSARCERACHSRRAGRFNGFRDSIGVATEAGEMAPPNRPARRPRADGADRIPQLHRPQGCSLWSSSPEPLSSASVGNPSPGVIPLAFAANLQQICGMAGSYFLMRSSALPPTAGTVARV